ncbi:MAG: hypothetical protein OEY20_06315 [Gemmatimonadota bacterium]|nr:hypothetical protein [Gemmatimonadota bacterium]MDH5196847.1 hypothetical protein [Gemmatimonadota bacterium]
MTDAKRCQYLLALANSNHSMRVFLRTNGWRYALILALFVPVTYLAAADTLALRPLWAGLIGALAGALLRDAGWVARIRETWPLTVRITNWDLVREIANGRAAGAADHASPTGP